MKENLFWIWISRLEYMNYETLEQLLRDFGSFEKIWNLKRKDIEEKEYLSNYLKRKILDKSLKENLQKYLDYIKRNNISIISYKDNLYPKKLQFIENRPIVIYAKGNLEGINNESVRNCWSKRLYKLWVRSNKNDYI